MLYQFYFPHLKQFIYLLHTRNHFLYTHFIHLFIFLVSWYLYIQVHMVTQLVSSQFSSFFLVRHVKYIVVLVHTCAYLGRPINFTFFIISHRVFSITRQYLDLLRCCLAISIPTTRAINKFVVSNCNDYCNSIGNKKTNERKKKR